MTFISGTYQTLERALDYSAAKHKAISSNIANIDTPNYKAKAVSFRDSLGSEMKIQALRTDPKHMEFLGGQEGTMRVNRLAASYNNNRNNVDIDKEMSELATNQIYYNAVSDRLSGKYKSLMNVIKGGNG
ncbi:MAG: flagellar basal body rod protein FlgB [Bacillus sp. (in: firmicutes)]